MAFSKLFSEIQFITNSPVMAEPASFRLSLARGRLAFRPLDCIFTAPHSLKLAALDCQSFYIATVTRRIQRISYLVFS